jgi:hypothetical protein
MTQPEQSHDEKEPTTLYEQVYRQISFKTEIGKYREAAEQFLSESSLGSPLVIASALTAHPKIACALVDEKLMKFSNDFQHSFPLLSTLTNSHSQLLVGLTTSIVAVPTVSK